MRDRKMGKCAPAAYSGIPMAKDSSNPRSEKRVQKNPSRLKSEHEYQVVFDAVDDIILVLEPNGRIVLANKAAVRFSGLPIEKILGMHCHQIVHGTDIPITLCPRVKMLNSHKSEDSDIYLDQKGIWVRA